MNRILALLIIIFPLAVFAQSIRLSESNIDYSNPKKYEIGGVIVEGTSVLDPSAVKLLSGLQIGDKIEIPGEEISKAIKNLWGQGLFSNIDIGYESIQADKIFIKITVEERARLSRFKFEGVKKSEADDIREEINLFKEKIVTDNLLVTTTNKITHFYVDKGFLNAKINIQVLNDSAFANHVLLIIKVDKGRKVKIKKISIEGNSHFSDLKLKRLFKDTKEKSVIKPFANFDSMLVASVKTGIKEGTKAGLKTSGEYFANNVRIRLFKSSKFMEATYETDKQNVIDKYNKKGYRDAKIVSDTVVLGDNNTLKINLDIVEGEQYYFGDIKWVGNKKYSSQYLKSRLGIEKGDIYDPEKLESRLYMDQSGDDISALYMDDGYLFFQINPIETNVDNKTVNLEIQIYEGQQATIKQITVVGNTKTNDHVILREIRTKPGQLFSRADIIRSQRELSVLGYFNAEKLGVNPTPNQTDGTVDIEYVVEEAPSDQIQLSGGFGGNSIVGTLGVTFNNFSTRNFFKGSEWRPLPSGDGQRLSIQGQSNGWFYQSVNMSFTEPWLGGKKPNALTLSGYWSMQSTARKFIQDSTDVNGDKVENPNRTYVKITGASVGLGKRLTWPDDYFTLQQQVSYQLYNLKDWRQFAFTTGEANNLFYKIALSRSSQDQQIYPRLGSNISLSLQTTFPYSTTNNVDYGSLKRNYENEIRYNEDALVNDVTNAYNQKLYRWVEYHKWKFTSSTFTSLVGNLVLNTRVGFGFLGHFNKNIGTAPLERFYLGGSGLSGFALDGREIIALRGYNDQSVSPVTGGSIISKYTAELRYPFTLNPSATIYGMAFAEAGNTWDRFIDYNPFSVKRSAGVGLRVFLPMFGLLGLDYGWRFDDVPSMTPLNNGGKRGQLHFTIGMNLGEL